MTQQNAYETQQQSAIVQEFPILPRNDFSWAQYAGAQTFVAYNVHRQEIPPPGGDTHAQTTRIRIATISDVSTLSYRDYAVASRRRYAYDVTVTTSQSGSLFESAPQDPAPTAQLLFEYGFIHSVSNPSLYACTFSFASTVAHRQDLSLRQSWGEAAPSATRGEQDYYEFDVDSLPDVYRGAVIRALEQLADAQGGENVLMMRTGTDGRRAFGVLVDLTARNEQRQYSPRFRFIETAYTEAV